MSGTSGTSGTPGMSGILYQKGVQSQSVSPFPDNPASRVRQSESSPLSLFLRGKTGNPPFPSGLSGSSGTSEGRPAVSRRRVSAKRRRPRGWEDKLATPAAAWLRRIDLALATREWADAQHAQDPFEIAFREAHRVLRELPPQPVTSKADRLAAYDARLAAGHAWNPHRARLRDANRWIAAIQEEIDWYD